MENKNTRRMFAFENKCKPTMKSKPVFDYQQETAKANKALAEKNRKAKESNKLDKNLLFNEASPEQLHQLAHIAVYMALQAKARFGEDTLYRAFPIACKAPWTNSDSETVYDYIEDCFLYYMESQASGKYEGMTIYETEEIQRGTKTYHYGPYHDGKKLVYRALYQTSKHQAEIDTDAQDAITGVKHLASEEAINHRIMERDVQAFWGKLDSESKQLIRLKYAGKTQMEIAEAMNTTQKTVSKKLAKLSKLFAEGTEEEYKQEHTSASKYLQELKKARLERSLADLPESIATDTVISATSEPEKEYKSVSIWEMTRQAYRQAGYDQIELDDGTTEKLDYNTDDSDNRFSYVYKSKKEALASRTW